MVLSLFFISFFNENGNGKNEFFESLFETRGKENNKNFGKTWSWNRISLEKRVSVFLKFDKSDTSSRE